MRESRKGNGGSKIKGSKGNRRKDRNPRGELVCKATRAKPLVLIYDL
jgi:hypothetical protein